MKPKRSSRGVSLGFAAVALLAAAGANAAGNSGFYVGGSGGLSRLSISTTGFNEFATGFKGFGGYAISDIIAFEAAYFDTGTASVTFTNGTGAEIGASGINGSIILRARTASALVLYAKVGYSQYDFEVTGLGANAAAVTAAASKNGVSWGGGLSYTFRDRYSIRAEYEGIDVNEARLNLMTIGASILF